MTKINNVIPFPGVKKNIKLQEQEDLLLENANKINDLMLQPGWDLVKINDDLLSVICEFGEALPVRIIASHRLNAVLAAQIILGGQDEYTN